MQDNYELVYGKLLKKLAEVDLAEAATSLGGQFIDGDLEITSLGTPFLINHEGIWKKNRKDPNISVRIVLCHYLLQAGQGDLTGEWVSYRDFKDSAFFISNFQVNTEERIARHFSGKAAGLESAGKHLHGRPYEEFQTGDVCYYFQALPRVPLLLVFYDKDEDFPASCKVLFDRSAPIWLDMECLAVLGWIVADLLIRK
jgi:hypothetical protein